MSDVTSLGGLFSVRRSLTGKLLVTTAVVVTLLVGAAAAMITSMVARDARDAVMSEGTQIGLRHASDVQRDLNSMIDLATHLRDAVASARKAGVANRDYLNQLLKDTTTANPNLIGAYAGFEPNALDGRDQDFVNRPGSDGTGRFLSYWNRANGMVALNTLTGYDQGGDGDYYQLPKATLKTQLLEPYSYSVGGKDILMTSISVPLVENGTFIGVVGVDLALDELTRKITSIKPLGTGAVAIVSNGGRWVADARPHYLGKRIEETDPTLDAARGPIAEGKFFQMTAFSQALQTDILRLVVPIPMGDTDRPWGLLVGLPQTQADNTAAEIRNLMIIGSVVLLVVLIVTLGSVLVYVVRRPLARSIGVIRQLAAGNYDVTVPDQNRLDEIGHINQTLQSFKESAHEMRAMEDRQRQSQERAAIERRQAMMELADRFEAEVSSVVDLVASAAGEMERTAGSMTSTAEQTSQQAQAVSAGANQAAANVQTVAAATEELSASISEVTKQMSQSSQIAARAVNDAQHTDQTIASLAEAVDRIGTVVDLITSIAGQTNLLALNATIEAARAGEAGKGFAVVASEVKSLANQTAKATDEIASEIARIQAVTAQTVEAIKVISGTIDEMSEITGAVAAAAEEQAAATAEITRNLQEASHGTQDVSSNITGVSHGADHTGEAATAVLSAASQLGRHAEELRGQVDQFIANVRAA